MRKVSNPDSTVNAEQLHADLCEIKEILGDRRAKGRLLTVKDVAEYLQLSPRTIERRIARGDLNPIRIGGVRRFSKEQIDAYLRRNVKR